MENKIRFVKDIRIIKENAEPDLMAIKAKGIAELKKLIAPILIPREYEKPPGDGIYELDFILDNTGEDYTNVELEVDVVFRVKSMPDWVKGVKINAAENSDIELI
ncbi:MAG: hypothetical protein JW731_05140 [Bacteroidales bacterium]|nr:hypothetical protein [Bacteroidales bacterium]